MSDNTLNNLPDGFKGMAHDMGSDQTAFKGVQWGKFMMWIFLLSDTFVFSCFLISYMKGRSSTVVDWPNTSEVFSLHVGSVPVPLLLIAIMTFVLITSSGTMALAVKFGYENINFDSGEGIYNFLKEYSKSTRDGKLSDRATQAIDKAEAGVKTKIGDVGTADDIIQKSETSADGLRVNEIYANTADKNQAGALIAMEYQGMAENTFKSLRDKGNYTEDQINTLNNNKEDIIPMMLYGRIPKQRESSKSRNVLGLVKDFKLEKQKYKNVSAYINTFFRERSKEVFNYYVPDAIVESMNDSEGNIKTSVAKKSNTESNVDQGPEARALTNFNDLTINDENFITSDIHKSIKDKVINNITLLLSKGNLDVKAMTEIIEKEISNIIKKAQGKISKSENKVVISKEYDNFVREVMKVV
jgi:hypothetical protein